MPSLSISTLAATGPCPPTSCPGVIPLEHWETIAAGVSQRIRAINRFLADLYNDEQDVVPDEVIYTSQYFYPEAQGFRPPKDVFVHIYGIDLVPFPFEYALYRISASPVVIPAQSGIQS